MEYTLGKKQNKLKHPDGTKYKAMPETSRCEGCEFNGSACPRVSVADDEYSSFCTSWRRTDGRGIIWVKIKKD